MTIKRSKRNFGTPKICNNLSTNLLQAVKQSKAINQQPKYKIKDYSQSKNQVIVGNDYNSSNDINKNLE